MTTTAAVVATVDARRLPTAPWPPAGGGSTLPAMTLGLDGGQVHTQRGIERDGERRKKEEREKEGKGIENGGQRPGCIGRWRTAAWPTGRPGWPAKERLGGIQGSREGG